MEKTIHEGHNIRRFREMLGIKQETLASELGLSQQAISNLEQKETIDERILVDVAKILKVPTEAIKNFDEESALNIISTTFSDFRDNASAINYNCNLTFNPVEKIVELYEALLKSEREKIELLQKIMEK